MSEIRKLSDKLDKSGAVKSTETSGLTAEICGTISEHDWEVFVIKYDPSAGKFVGKTACCALAPV